MEIAIEEINTFVSSSDSQFQALIATMYQRIQDLEEEVKSLRSELESYQENNELERAFDRKRIAKIEAPAIQPRQKDRGEILRALLAAYGGKMLESEARKMMGLKANQFSMLLGTLEDYIETRSYHLDNRQKLLILK